MTSVCYKCVSFMDFHKVSSDRDDFFYFANLLKPIIIYKQTADDYYGVRHISKLVRHKDNDKQCCVCFEFFLIFSGNDRCCVATKEYLVIARYFYGDFVAVKDAVLFIEKVMANYLRGSISNIK